MGWIQKARKRSRQTGPIRKAGRCQDRAQEHLIGIERPGTTGPDPVVGKNTGSRTFQGTHSDRSRHGGGTNSFPDTGLATTSTRVRDCHAPS